MRAYAKLVVVISNDVAQEETVFDNRKKAYTIDDNDPGPAKGVGKSLTLLASSGTTYQRIALDGVVPKMLFIQSDGDITVRLNSVDGNSGTEIPITPLVPTVSAPTPTETLPPQKGSLFLRGALGSFDVWVSNKTSPIKDVRVELTAAG